MNGGVISMEPGVEQGVLEIDLYESLEESTLRLVCGGGV